MPSEDTKERITKVVEIGRTVLHYGWIPFIIYVGFTRSNPQPSLIKYVLRSFTFRTRLTHFHVVLD
ncbi:Tom7-domain-containing protein [Macrolepiota fuliginosa MF-IS2]|uniref:Tom7-domain-containing protein n=1 Tax=Macrolepiota fuliginosa MF-IS2 TaxID=1400762 RepID=A0A9P6C493_9AGAR|nr:Tom7-domain-containing protein [Macrolepiota fuliginosa MF-IS2]